MATSLISGGSRGLGLAVVERLLDRGDRVATFSRSGSDALAKLVARHPGWLHAETLDAADGIGMTRQQRLIQVELPLAAPIVMGGLRVAAVWTIGAATLATTVGQKSLGDLIFAGLQIEDWALVVTGCLASAFLARGPPVDARSASATAFSHTPAFTHSGFFLHVHSSLFEPSRSRPPPGIHADRAARHDRDHRHPARALAA
jgi:NAD(P)-dependent dehydrogenase (short-subunit alcohol dehydrogenase family)